MTETSNVNLSKFKVQKLPFQGMAHNLIDKFLIIGYNYSSIEKQVPDLLLQTKLYPDASQPLLEMDANELPEVMNEISNDYEKEILENDMILELIFPVTPKIYYNKNRNLRTNPESYTVIYSLSPSVNETNTKKSYICFTYIFYELDKSGFFFPKGFCFLSEYPYFSSFYNLSLRILNMFKNDMPSIPIEIWLYNFISFTPAPFHSNYDIYITKAQINNQNHNEDKIRSMIYTNNMKQDIISFPMLSGYPLFNFNLSVIFSIIPPGMILEIFIFTFLEVDILFYSKNLEILNFIMFVFSNLNYPCNDSIYFWHILSVSISGFMSGNSAFTNKACSTLIGINATYSPKVNTTTRIKDHFIADIDNKAFLYASAHNTESVRGNSLIVEHLEKIMSKPKEEAKDSEITKLLKSLYVNLDMLSKKCELMENSKYSPENGTTSSILYKYDKDIANENKNLQLLFYNFIVKVFSLYYKNYTLKQEKPDEQIPGSSSATPSSFSSCNKTIKSETKSAQGFITEFNNNYLFNFEFDRLFNEKFRDSSKFGNFLINFLLYYDTINSFKIPLLFTEELMNRICFKERRNDAENTKKLFKKKNDVRNSIDDFLIKDIFNIIDQYYSIKKEEDILKISNPNHKFKVITQFLNFNEFYEYYDKELKTIFTREQIESKFVEMRYMPATKKMFLSYKKIELDEEFLLKYIYYIQNLEEEEINKIFPINKIIENNKIQEFAQASINDIIEQILISQKDFQRHDFIIFIIYTLFATTRGFSLNEKSVQELKILINLSNTLLSQNLRNYTIKIIYIYLKLALKAKNENNYENLFTYNKCLNEFKKLILGKSNVLPNEEFMSIINQEINAEEASGNNKEEGNSQNDANEFKVHFIYENLEGTLKKKKEKKLINSLWVFSSNLDIDSEILQPDRDGRKNSCDEASSEYVNKNPNIRINCSVEGEENSNRIIRFYSIKMLFNEANKLYRSYFEDVNLSAINLEKVEELLWNIVYYIYLGCENGDNKFNYHIFKDIQQVFINLILIIRKQINREVNISN